MNKLVLGTVQFGLNYGITNHSGQAKVTDVREILDFAKENGIDTLDTASGYGNCEQVLGEIGINDFNVITKTTALKDSILNVIDDFQVSLVDLDQKQVEGLLIHNISDVENNQFNDLFKKLNKLKQEGFIKKIGFSTYTPGQVDFLLANFDFDLIQIPFNVFDTRLIEGGQLNSLKKNDVEVHARSVFLQGVLLNLDHLSEYFSTWEKQFTEYQVMVRNSGLSLLEYALNFVLNIQEIDRVLVGINNERELREILKSVKRLEPLAPYSINDENLLNPSLWKT